jgi:hypothetical protein
MYRIKQCLDDTRVDNIGQAVFDELEKLSVTEVKPGHRVAIAAGSRGITNITEILKAIVDFFMSLGAEPFVFPAMGSHGGATAKGQVTVLEHFGISESYLEVPILSSMEAIQIGEIDDDVPVFLDKNALEAHHIVVVNRIKSHTKFKAPIESGLMKMMAIGMGKQKGAELYHKAAIQHTFPKIIVEAARQIIQKTPVLCGIGIIENGYSETAGIKAIRAAEIESQEKEMLSLAKQMSPKLPVDDIDLLIVDEMGKDISGVGMDPNVTGRNRDILGVFPHPAKIKRIFVRDLTKKSNGNATGIGLADLTTKRLVEKIDCQATYRNAITGISLEKAAIPMHFETDKEAIAVALGSIGLIPPEQSRVVRISNTLDLELMEVSGACVKAVDNMAHIELLDGPVPMAFDANGNLLNRNSER